jgi:predicted CXXCH cytochrome family protein
VILKKRFINLGSVLAAIALLIVVLVLFSEAAFRPVAQPAILVASGLGHLRGKVIESDGWIPFVLPAIDGADVTLDPGAITATSAGDGFFDIPEVEPGVYRVTIAAPGFEAAVVDGVVIAEGIVTTLPEVALFPEPAGPPVARLAIGTLAPFGAPPSEFPYLTAVYLDATGSENVSRSGIRFEIRDAAGELLTDSYAPDDAPLQPSPIAVPGVSPAMFSLTLPRPGDYSAKIFLRNAVEPDVEASAEVAVRAVNAAPEALPMLIAGPQPPRKSPIAGARASSGLTVIQAGTGVYLMGYGLDRNHATPDLYNPGGQASDIYGKNDDHLQRQFGFSWDLVHVDVETGTRTRVDEALLGPDGSQARYGQVVHFAARHPGRYEATLTVTDNDPFGSLTSEPATVTVLVMNDSAPADVDACAECHAAEVAEYRRTTHSNVGVGCEHCHGPAASHLAIEPGADDYAQRKAATQDVSFASGTCGQCHGEYAEWEKSRHADGMAYGYHEIGQALLVQCSKCHYARTFAATVESAADAGGEFHDVSYSKRVAGIGPRMPDLTKAPAKDEVGISCVACHRPHDAGAGGSAGLRTGEPGPLCQTCHEQKWQNTMLEATAGEVGNGYEYPGEDYDVFNAHDTPKKCVLCHGGDLIDALDGNGVRAVGGHTLRMRDAGADGRLGGFGPRPDAPASMRNPDDADDVLNNGACSDCHGDIESFDVGGTQAEIHAAWRELGELLAAANGGTLPGFKPGDKCATCHRGGTMPFDDDPALVLENAYTNYKLIGNDRSWGVHNPRYARKLLADSVAAVRAYVDAHDDD